MPTNPVAFTPEELRALMRFLHQHSEQLRAHANDLASYKEELALRAAVDKLTDAHIAANE